jgi:ribosomal protein S18 acetylase RimI-like enzyme
MKLEPLSQAELGLAAALMDSEEHAWLQELDWDYSPIRRILDAFLKQRLLPGFLLSGEKRAFGYVYFLVSRGKGVIGTLYTLPPHAQNSADRILTRAIECMKEYTDLRRIEAQIIPLHGLDLRGIFARLGFREYLRHYLELDLKSVDPPEASLPVCIVPWQPDHLLPAAALAHRSYRNGIDAEISEDYRTEANCATYLRSLVDNPGCGIFLPDCSFVALDRGGIPSGFILTSRISQNAAMIPQISVHPAHQATGLGTALMQQALSRLRDAGFQTARLTVTRQNRRAYEWYLRLGFRVRRDFYAFLWQSE